MLAKLARLCLIAESLGRHSDALVLAQRLAERLETWIDPEKVMVVVGVMMVMVAVGVGVVVVGHGGGSG
jgi:hypothetical protein